jgi:hypothetical protein
VLIDACEVCAYRQPEDAERPCPRCGNGIYVAMTVAKAYATAKEWAHPTKPAPELWHAIFPDQASYDASVESVAARIASGEVKPIEQEGGQANG